MVARVVALAILCIAVASSSGRAKEASPQMLACHNEAAEKYIADFRQVSQPQEVFVYGIPVIVITVENVTPRYEQYRAACMARANKKI